MSKRLWQRINRINSICNNARRLSLDIDNVWVQSPHARLNVGDSLTANERTQLQDWLNRVDARLSGISQLMVNAAIELDNQADEILERLDT